MNYKLPKEIKEKMEREIRQYKHNKKKLERLKAKLEQTRRLLYLEERIFYVEEVISKLNENEKEVYKLIFEKSYNWLYCQTMFNIDKNTYYNVYNKTLYLLAQEWGEI